MAVLADLWIKKDTLKTILEVLENKDEKGVALTISLNDESNEWGQNVTAIVSQTKEQRVAGKPKFYVGNGKVFWLNDTGAVKAQRPEEQNQYQPEPENYTNNDPIPDADDLPF